MTLGLGIAIGMLIGAAGGAALVRYGMKLHERITWGLREDRPVFSEYEPPLTQTHTGDETEDEERET